MATNVTINNGTAGAVPYDIGSHSGNLNGGQSTGFSTSALLGTVDGVTVTLNDPNSGGAASNGDMVSVTTGGTSSEPTSTIMVSHAEIPVKL